MPVLQRRRVPLHLDDTWCLPGERWRPIPDWVGYYEASDYGRVRSVERRCRSGGSHSRRVPACVLRQSRRGEGYFGVDLVCEGESKNADEVHRLVLLAFVGPCPPGYEVLHRNGNKGDNRLENLKWGTKVENKRDRRRHGTSTQGENNVRAKLTDGKVRSMRRSFARGGISRKQLVRDYGVSKTTVVGILNRSIWVHLEARDDEKMPELGSAGPKRLLTTADVQEAQRRIKQGELVWSIANVFGVSQTTLYRARLRAGVI